MASTQVEVDLNKIAEVRGFVRFLPGQPLCSFPPGFSEVVGQPRELEASPTHDQAPGREQGEQLRAAEGGDVLLGPPPPPPEEWPSLSFPPGFWETVTREVRSP
jgi:hypothetical protein